MSFQSNLAPGVFQNLVTHAIAMALVPLGVFFAVKWAGFSGTAAAISESSRVQIHFSSFQISMEIPNWEYLLLYL